MTDTQEGDTNQQIREDLLRAQRALIDAREAPVGDVSGEIEVAKGFVDSALRKVDSETNRSGSE